MVRLIDGKILIIILEKMICYLLIFGIKMFLMHSAGQRSLSSVYLTSVNCPGCFWAL